jgi:hypothetical protein
MRERKVTDGASGKIKTTVHIMVFADSPAGELPEKNGNQRDEGQCQCVADVHGAEKVAGLAIVPKMADGTAFEHFREAEEDGVIVDCSDGTAWAAMGKNVANRCNHSEFHGRE